MEDSVSIRAFAHKTLFSEAEITKEISSFFNQGYESN